MRNDDNYDDLRRRWKRFWLLGLAMVILFTLLARSDQRLFDTSSNQNEDENDKMVEIEVDEIVDNVLSIGEGTEKVTMEYNKVTTGAVLSGDLMYKPPPLPGNITNSYDPTALLLIKVPKVGGTTLSITLERYAQVRGLHTARPGTVYLRTCSGSELAKESWEKMLGRNGGKIDAWVTHSCFQPFMLANNHKRYWRNPARQLAVTMLREPWSRTVSLYRYIQLTCRSKSGGTYKPIYCGRGFENFLQSACGSERCSEQFHFITGTKPRQITPERAKQLVSRYDLVFLTERFNEGLVVLHLKFGFPWITLPYMLANHNANVPYPKENKVLKQKILNSSLKPDVLLYQAAVEKMDQHILSIGNDTFYSTLELLNEINQRASVECVGKIDKSDCIEKDRFLKHGAACFESIGTSLSDQVK